MVRIPTSRRPSTPGDVLLQDFLKPMEISQRELADKIHVPYQRVNDIVNGRRSVTPSIALRLAKFFGTSSDFWINLQLRQDLFVARQEESDVLSTIEPHST
ncbi:MAG: HigA family addiction module antitoxin [Planctomycetes bacterium]|nr:HigA family addiction module antitoxin [Planctomycetota bacterium]